MQDPDAYQIFGFSESLDPSEDFLSYFVHTAYFLLYSLVVFSIQFLSGGYYFISFFMFEWFVVMFTLTVVSIFLVCLFSAIWFFIYLEATRSDSVMFGEIDEEFANPLFADDDTTKRFYPV